MQVKCWPTILKSCQKSPSFENTKTVRLNYCLHIHKKKEKYIYIFFCFGALSDELGMWTSNSRVPLCLPSLDCMPLISTWLLYLGSKYRGRCGFYLAKIHAYTSNQSTIVEARGLAVEPLAELKYLAINFRDSRKISFYCAQELLLQIFQVPRDMVGFLDEVMLRHHACHSLTLSCIYSESWWW